MLAFISVLMASAGFCQTDPVKVDTAEIEPPDTAYSDTTNIEKNDTVTLFNTVNTFEVKNVQGRTVPDTAIARLKKDDAFWYANKAPEKEKPASEVSFWDWFYKQGWLKSLIWMLLVGGFLAVLIWFLATSNIFLFRKQSKKSETATSNDITEDIFTLDYESEIQKAMEAQNFRLATRLFFLQTLKNLAAKNIIQYKADRTNSDYLAQLDNTSYYKDFFRLARNFEYAWYGQMEVSPAAFAIMKNNFETFNRQFA